MNLQEHAYAPYTVSTNINLSREVVVNFEQKLIQHLEDMGVEVTPGNTDKDFPITNHFAPGLYAREILLPAGSVIVGKIHNHSHINTISKGKVKVATEWGVELFEAPYTFVSKPGTKRIVYALEDTIWTTYHPTDETDVSKIEEDIISPSFEAYDQKQLLLKGK